MIASETSAPKKRGRPAAAAVDGAADDEVDQPPKKRGRPSKATATTETVAEPSTAKTPARKAGRPPKTAAPKSAAKPAAKASTAKASAKKPGRPAKAKTTKAPEPEEAPDAIDTPAPRKRHSGPKGGETTKIAADDGNAADQLEGELQDVAEPAKPGRKRKTAAGEETAPAKASKAINGKGKAKAATTEADDDTGAALADGKNFWLLKAEQIDRFEKVESGGEVNTKFTIDDLKAATEPEPWDGVRNTVARNNMRAMKVGDLAFFYASQSKGKLQPGITGIMEIVSGPEPDPSASDPNHYAFIKDENKRDWTIVRVEFRKKLSQPVTLKQLQQFGRDGGVLSGMQVLNSARLSVTHVSEQEWNFIVDELIDGYEDNDGDAALGVPVSKPDPKLPPTLSAAAPLIDLNSDLPAAKAATSRPASRVASRQTSLAPPIIETTESSTVVDTSSAAVDSLLPTPRAGSKKPASRAGSKQPASRAGSKQPASRAGSVKPASRAGSLAPSDRPASRGRSRTPRVRGSSIMPDVMGTVAEEMEEQVMGGAEMAREMELA